MTNDLPNVFVVCEMFPVEPNNIKQKVKKVLCACKTKEDAYKIIDSEYNDLDVNIFSMKVFDNTQNAKIEEDAVECIYSKTSF